MSFVNGVLDSSPVALPKITPPKRTLPSLDDVASRIAKGKKRKADFDHASSLLERTNRKDGKRIKTATRGGRENEGDEHSSQLPTATEKKKKELDTNIRGEVGEEAVVERFLRLSSSMGLDPARRSEQAQAPLTPPASYRTIQPKASGARAVSEPASPSSNLTSPSSKSTCSTVADELSHVDLDNPFIETPAGLTRSTLFRRQSVPDSPDELESETFRQNILKKLRSDGFSPAGPVDVAEPREEPPIETDSQGEKSYLTYLFKGKRVFVPNELFNVPHDPRNDLPVTDPNYVPELGLKPTNLFPKSVYGREARKNVTSSSKLAPGVIADDPFIDRPVRKRT